MDYRQFIHNFQPGDILLIGEPERYKIHVYLGDRYWNGVIKCLTAYVGKIKNSVININEFWVSVVDVQLLERVSTDMLLKLSIEFSKNKVMQSNLNEYLYKMNIPYKLINIRKNNIDELLDYYEKY